MTVPAADDADATLRDLLTDLLEDTDELDADELDADELDADELDWGLPTDLLDSDLRNALSDDDDIELTDLDEELTEEEEIDADELELELDDDDELDADDEDSGGQHGFSRAYSSLPSSSF